MTIPVLNFPMLNFEQANPGFAGAQAMNSLIGQALQNQQQRLQTQYMPQMLQQQAQQAALKTQMMQPEAQYAQPMTLADLALKQAQLPLMQAQVADILTGRVPLEQAQAQEAYAQIPKLQMETQVLPMQAMGSYLAGMGRMGMANYYNNPATQLARVLNAPAMESLISTNPEVAQNVASALASGSAKAASMANMPAGGGMPPTAASLGLVQPPMPSQFSPQSAAMIPTVMQTGIAQTPGNMATAMQMPQPQMPTLSADDYTQMQQNLSDILERKTTTAQILNQRQYAGILDNLFDRGSQLIPAVAQYAGLAGKGQQGLDALKSSFGETSPQYQDYLYFSRTLAPILSNEMRRTLGGQATDNEQKAMGNLANPTWIDSNPQQAMSQYQFLQSVYRSSVNPALAARPNQTLASLQSGSVRNNPPAVSAPSAEDIAFTAQKYGMTIDQVKQKLGIQ